ncbi:peptide deformylase [Schaalia sp. 19OD2882]|uniref:peptide deformylase n=1 Tax=Schaalia sp. 19OD2882 TaxID=2794089 RepID=UPI001C1ED4C5|nr:peptide deformylase [Schaalia sp. 19OD2882]QWW20347.1 peptide deformylase [Schaalia sp. 19OD2882]
MSILPIRVWGDEVLHNRAREVGEIDEAVRTLVADMVETMHAADGVGLAAPQVGHGLRIFVWHHEGGHPWDARLDPAERPGPSSGVVIDPVLELSDLPQRAADPDTEMEGCLSLPGLAYPVVRATRAILTGRDLDGEPLRIEACGWLARIFQHEFDHLDGIVYTQRLGSPWAQRAERAIAAAGWNGGQWDPSAAEDDAPSRTRARRPRRGPGRMRLAGRGR